MYNRNWKNRAALAFVISSIAAGAPIHAQEVTPAITGVVQAGTKIELVKEGFKGTEGPVRHPDGSFLFTETQDNRITRIAEDGSISNFLSSTNGSNGLGFTANGDLYAVQVLETRVGIVHPPERARTLADNYEGLKFGRPNDLVVSSKGVVYFTDSGANGPVKPDPATTAKPAVYKIDAKGQLSRIANDIGRPNGIQLSPDEKTLYVANTLGEHVLAYTLHADGSIGERRNFAKLAGWRKTENGFSSGADGLAIDGAGRLYVATSAGIEVFSPHGEAQGVIVLPKSPQNIAFAGKNKDVLYAVGRGSAYRIQTLTTGFSGRAK